MTAERPVLLIVEDESTLAELYSRWFAEDYEVRTAANGREALAQLDASVDVVILDRRLPGLSGDEVLDRVEEAGFDCSVAMVTAAEPDFDILEMGFDDYLTKPASMDDLKRVVDGLLRRSTYDQAVQEYYTLVRKRAALEAENTPTRLADDDRYWSLTERIRAYEDELDSAEADLEPTDYEAAFMDLAKDLRRTDTG